MKEKTLTEKIAEMREHIPQAAEWLDTFRGNSTKTSEAYATNLAILFEGLGINNFEQVVNFTTADLSRVHGVASSRGWSKSTTNRYVENFRRFMRWCSEEGLTENRVLERYKKLRSEAEPTYVFTLEEEEKILKAITSKRLRCMLNLFLEIGNRKSSVMNIKLDDIKGDMLTITDKGDKTTSHKLSAEMLEMLNDYIKTDRAEIMARYTENGGTDLGYLFVSNFSGGRFNTNYSNGLRLADNALNIQIKNIARKAGIENWEKIVPHSFRKRFGINTYYENGCDIIKAQREMNHSNVNTTAYYIGKYSITDEEKEELAKRSAKPTIESLEAKIEELIQIISNQNQLITKLSKTNVEQTELISKLKGEQV